jgi:hypothetical protein
MVAFSEKLEVFPAELAVPASGAGAPMLVERISSIIVQVVGTFTGTFDLESSVDGENWIVDTTGISAGYISVTDNVRFIRLTRTGAGTDPTLVTVDGDGYGEG